MVPPIKTKQVFILKLDQISMKSPQMLLIMSMCICDNDKSFNDAGFSTGLQQCRAGNWNQGINFVLPK